MDIKKHYILSFNQHTLFHRHLRRLKWSNGCVRLVATAIAPVPQASPLTAEKKCSSGCKVDITALFPTP
jgi:hypothetical protein